MERYIERQLSFDVRSSDRRKELEKRDWAYGTVEQEPRVQMTRQYLGWLARSLKRGNQTEFLLEKMQPSWLDDKERSRYGRAICLLLGQALGISFGIPFRLMIGLTGGLSQILHQSQ